MGLNVLYLFWSVGIWVVSFGFSTLWVQNIHDSLMAKKLAKLKKSAAEGDK
jgi:hypothetical protein